MKFTQLIELVVERSSRPIFLITSCVGLGSLNLTEPILCRQVGYSASSVPLWRLRALRFNVGLKHISLQVTVSNYEHIKKHFV